MKRDIKAAFDAVTASPAMKEAALAHIARQTERRRCSAVRPALVAAVCCVAVFFGIGGWWAWRQPVSFISVDVNPSLELSLNRWDKVVLVEAFSPDSEAFLALPLKGKSYSEAVTTLLAEEEAKGLLRAESLVTFTVHAQDREKQAQLMTSLEGLADRELSGVEVHCTSAEPGLWQEAHHYGLSAGKYKAIVELMEVDPTATLEGCRHHSMRQIREQTQASGESSADDSGGGMMCGEGSQGHHGGMHGRSQ